MPQFSLKARMSFTVMTLVLVIMAGVGCLALYYFKQSYRQLIAEQQTTLVEQIAARIDTQLRQASRLIVRTAEDFPLSALNSADRAQTYLDTRLGLGTTSLFDNGIFLFTAQGTLIAEHPFKPGRRGRDYAFRTYFQDTVRSDRPQISEPYISSQQHHHPAVNFTAPIRDRQGRLIAVLAGSVDLTRNNFLGGLSEVSIGHSGYLYLYNIKRRIIMHPDPKRVMQQDVPIGANIWFDRALEGFEGTAETVNSRGLHTLATFKRLNGDHWILAANYPVAEAYLPIRRAERYFLFGLVTILLFSIAVTWLGTRLLLAPLARLNRHVASFSENDRDDRAENGDEISVLATTFDRLMVEVAEQRRTAADRLVFLQGIIDTFPHPVFYQSLTGELLGGNLALQNLCGKPLKQLIGTTLDHHLPATTAELIDAVDNRLLTGELPLLNREATLPMEAGPPRHALIHQALLKDGRGEPQGLVSSLIDISDLKNAEFNVTREREFSLRLLENSATPCFVIDAEHQVLIWTRALEGLTGLKAAEVLGTRNHWQGFYAEPRPCLADIVLDKDFATAIDHYPLLANSPLAQDGLQSEDWLTLKNGRRRYLTFDAAPIYDSSGQLVAVIETLHDLTNLKEAEKTLREAQESYLALADSSPDAILVHRQGVVLYGNRAAAQLFQAPEPAALTDMSIEQLIHPDSHDLAFAQIAEVEILQRETLYLEETIVRCDGARVQVEVGLSPTRFGGEWAVQAVLRDITERMAEQERIWHQANFDALTGLPNRNLFLDRLTQTLGRCDREGLLAALMFIDLDHFKAINDTLGHDNGDELLRQAAGRMSDCLRQTDTVARLGGDEFTVVLPVVTDIQDLQTTASRLIEALSRPFHLPGGTGRISCSIGAAIYPHDAQTIDNLMCVADAAMYRVKQTGRNGYYFAELDQVQTPITA